MTSYYTSTASAKNAPLSGTIRKTLTNTFITVGIMLLITGLSGYLTQGLALSLIAQIGLFVLSLGLLFGIHMARKSGLGLVLLAVFSGVLGVSAGPALARYLSLPNGGQLVFTSAIMTAAVTFGCAAYVLTTRKSFSNWGAALMGITLLLIVAAIANMFFQVPGLSIAVSAVGAVLFTAWMLFDISRVVSGEETNYITAAVGIYLDVINLFLNILNLGSAND